MLACPAPIWMTNLVTQLPGTSLEWDEWQSCWAAASGMKPLPLSVQCREVQFPSVDLLHDHNASYRGYIPTYGFKIVSNPMVKAFFSASAALHGSSSDRVPTSWNHNEPLVDHPTNHLLRTTTTTAAASTATTAALKTATTTTTTTTKLVVNHHSNVNHLCKSRQSPC